jgi:1D-myo-inositol 3-kinase
VLSEATTQMRNEYDAEGRRTQHVPRRAGLITAADLPDAWRETRVVLLGPVAGEIEAPLVSAFADNTLIGIGAQGWLREFMPDASVHPVPPQHWDTSLLLKHANALFLSDEDIPPDPSGDRPTILDKWAQNVDVLAFTRGYSGADISYHGEWRHIEAVRSDPTDLTGAGDVFAAAFLIRYSETGDPWVSARFAAAASSLVIEGEGVGGVPTRDAVAARLA